MKKLVLVLGILLIQLALPAQTFIHCGKLIDGNSKEVQSEMTITIQDNIIQSIHAGYQSPRDADAHIIDLKDYTVMPGLMDMHVHIEMEFAKGSYINRFTLNDADVAYIANKYAEITLMAGFTTVRDLGGTGVNVSLRNAINKGLTIGPRIYTVAKSIAITGGHADPTNGAKKGIWETAGPEQGVADGVDACRQAVRQQVKNGADLIKITATGGVLSLAKDGHRPQFTLEEIESIIQTADDFGIAVAAHAHGDEGMYRAVKAGISSIEHGTMMSERTMDLMKEMGTYYVPTLTAGKSVTDSARVKSFFPPMVTTKALQIGPQIAGTFAKAYKRGVKIAFGTDAGVFPHGKNGLEFGYMVEGGMSPMETILSATVEASKLLRVDDVLGTISKGKLADIVAVKGDPLEDISKMTQIDFVMKDGVVYKQEDKD